MVLVRPGPSRVHEELLARLPARPEALVVDAEVDHAHLLLGNAEPLDERRGRVVGDRDDELAQARVSP